MVHAINSKQMVSLSELNRESENSPDKKFDLDSEDNRNGGCTSLREKNAIPNFENLQKITDSSNG